MHSELGISIVIPLFNKVQYIKRALDSVLAQTYHDFEVIVVNDGSTDGSEKIVKQYTDPRIQLIRREHINSLGGHAARNLGIEKAKCELIAFLDADDEWLPEHLETIMRLVKNFPKCGAFGTTREFVLSNNIRIKQTSDEIPSHPWEGVIPNYFRSFYKSEQNSLICSSNVAILKKVFNVCGLFPIGEPLHGDWDMWCRIALKFPIAFSTKTGAIVYRGASGTASNFSNGCVLETLKNGCLSEQLPAGVSRSDLVELRIHIMMIMSMRYMMSGKAKEARKLLREAGELRSFSGRILRWYILTFFPLPIRKLMLKTWNLITKQIKHLYKTER